MLISPRGTSFSGDII